MRSSFRCLEDPTIPEEITTLADFIQALKQRCQDPSLSERATRTVENLYQNNMSFHEFITIFEDNMTDSSYGGLDKENWRVMLERRLSRRLRNALVTASNIPNEYHAFVAYLREKDAAFQEINVSNRPTKQTPNIITPTTYFSAPHSSAVYPPKVNELTVSQGGTAMDLDDISRQKGPDGHLTQPAKEARRTLGRCLWCNKPGHIALTCSLRNPSSNSHSVREVHTTTASDSLKD